MLEFIHHTRTRNANGALGEVAQQRGHPLSASYTPTLEKTPDRILFLAVRSTAAVIGTALRELKAHIPREVAFVGLYALLDSSVIPLPGVGDWVPCGIPCVTGGANSGKAGSLKLKRIGVERCRKLLNLLAEAHGNRTHPRRRNRRRTTVLKTAEGTSPRALPRQDCSGKRG